MQSRFDTGRGHERARAAARRRGAGAVPVLGVAGATQIAAGFGASCARLANGTADCWGSRLLGDCLGLTPSPLIGMPNG
jgi:hypothetical protein